MRAAAGLRRWASTHAVGVRRGSTPSSDGAAQHQPAALAPTRRPRHVEGYVVRVEQRSVSETVPALVALVEDAAGEQTKLIWLGRTGVRGIDVGTRVRASGLATTVKTLPAIYNPTYDLLPPDATQGRR